jgi:hypothetical protein
VKQDGQEADKRDVFAVAEKDVKDYLTTIVWPDFKQSPAFQRLSQIDGDWTAMEEISGSFGFEF